MKKIIILLLALFFTFPAFATEYFVREGGQAEKAVATGPITSLAGCMSPATHNAATFDDNDIITGGGTTYPIYSRIVPPSSGHAGNPITYRNLYIEVTVSLDGDYTFIYTYGDHDQPWTVCGGVYRKICTACPSIMYENGVKLTPVKTENETEAQSIITAGQYSWNNNCIYYLPSDGSNPITNGKTVRMPNRTYDAETAGLQVENKNHLTFQNISIKYMMINDNCVGAYFGFCDNIVIDGLESTDSHRGLMFVSTNAIANGLNLHHNFNVGLSVCGDFNTLTVTNSSFTYNGRVKYYREGALPIHTGDRDNIGIGQMGGSMGTITISQCNITHAGPPDTETTDSYGYGIDISTSEPCNVATLNIHECLLLDSHVHAINVNNIVQNVNFYNNIVIQGNNGYIASMVGLRPTTQNMGTWKFYNNLFALAKYNAAVNIVDEPTGQVHFKNNIFLDNGSSTNFVADFVLNDNPALVTLSDNCFWRSANAWSNEKLLVIWGEQFDLNEIEGEGVGKLSTFATYFTALTGNIAQDPLFFNAGGTDPEDYKLNSTSPCRNAGDAGVNSLVTTDFFLNPRNSNNTMGPYEFLNTGNNIIPRLLLLLLDD